MSFNRIPRPRSGAAADSYECVITAGDTRTLRARVVVAAHGSWDHNGLRTQPTRRPAGPSDLFGFKARFVGTRLLPGLMPLLTFPGGYGGMVHSDNGRVSLSCCIRRDWLARCRREAPGLPAGDAVLTHITRHCAGARDALSDARLEDRSWRSAGPIRPGIRGTRRDGIFLVGNAAGEAHPVVAEGISMAMQSSWLLVRRLLEPHVAGKQTLDHAAESYSRDWTRAFAWRIRAAAVIAHWAMHPAAVSLTSPSTPRVSTGVDRKRPPDRQGVCVVFAVLLNAASGSTNRAATARGNRQALRRGGPGRARARADASLRHCSRGA